MEVYVPSTRGTEPLRTVVFEQYAQGVAAHLTRTFGGCTCLYGTGYWYRDKHKAIVAEQVAVLVTYCEDSQENRDKAMSVGSGVARRLNQEAVLVAFDSTPHFVEP